jgi:hypothetical protein
VTPSLGSVESLVMPPQFLRVRAASRASGLSESGMARSGSRSDRGRRRADRT